MSLVTAAQKQVIYPQIHEKHLHFFVFWSLCIHNSQTQSEIQALNYLKKNAVTDFFLGWLDCLQRDYS